MAKIRSDDIASAAREWLVFLESGSAGRDDRERFEIWQQDSPDHRIAFQRITRTWQEIGEMSHLAELEPRHIDQGSMAQEGYLSGARVWFRRFCREILSWPNAAVTGVSIILLGFLLFPLSEDVFTLPAGDTQGYATNVAEIKTLILADGTEVILGAQSSIAVNFSKNERHVMLSGGEAFFSVSSNPNRPFIVKAADTLVRVTGTKFNVHSGVDRVTVAVAEGAVQVSKFKPGDNDNLYEQIGRASQLVAGQQAVSILRGPVQEVRVVATSNPGEWRTGRLSYEGTALRDVIADANRYLPRNILIGGEQVGDLLVTASFETRKISSLVDALALVLPIKVIEAPDGDVVLVAKKGD